MSQFDESTEKKAREYDARFGDEIVHYTAGRNSTKASLEILAREVLYWRAYGKPQERENVERVIAQVKANGDYPLEE